MRQVALDNFSNRNINNVISDGFDLIDILTAETLLSVALENTSFADNNWGFMRHDQQGKIFNYDGGFSVAESDSIREPHLIIKLGNAELAIVNGFNDLGEKLDRTVQVVRNDRIYSEII